METPKTVQAEVKGHLYEVTLHPTEDGIPLAAEVMSYLAEPFARLIDAWVQGQDDLENVELEDILRDVDWSAVGSDVSKVLQKIALNPGLVKRLLKHTTRDGKGLEMPSVFNEAYQGNYVELGLALFQVCKANGFLPFGG